MHKIYRRYMSSEQAIKRAQKKYESKFSSIKLRIPRDEMDEIRKYVADKGETMNAFVHRLIKEEMKRNP